MMPGDLASGDRRWLAMFQDAAVPPETPAQPHILLTNDNGVDAPGLVALEQALSAVGDGTDIGALDAGYISITPIVMDLTDYRNLPVLRAWQIALEDGAEDAERGRVSDSAPLENEP